MITNSQICDINLALETLNDPESTSDDCIDISRNVFQRLLDADAKAKAGAA